MRGGWKRPVFAVPGGDPALIPQPATEEKGEGADPPAEGPLLVAGCSRIAVGFEDARRPSFVDGAESLSEARKSPEALHVFRRFGSRLGLVSSISCVLGL